VLIGCAGAPSRHLDPTHGEQREPTAGSGDAAATDSATATDSAAAASATAGDGGRRDEPPEPRIDPDGNDERAEAAITLPTKARFAKVGRHWAALGRVCDFVPHGNALLMTHATVPLGLGGATVTRFAPSAKSSFSLSFDWNRPGEPERGGAGGQGFLRVRQIHGRLWVPDADPPYLGLGTRASIEGYVFASDAQGRFARAQNPGHRPPAAATAERGGTVVLPGALHVFDVIQFRGKLYASTGAAIPPKVTATSSPGTLFVQGASFDVWDVAYTYSGAAQESAVRLGYMTRFRDRLYVAISPLQGADRNDYLVLSPPKDAAGLEPPHARAVQITPTGGAHTLRWYTDRGKLFWITIGADGGELRVTQDGEHWQLLELPAEAGRPTDVLRAGEQLLVMAERALLRVDDAELHIVARVEGSKSPFAIDDAYCAAPLAVLGGRLYVGGQRRGALYRLEAQESDGG